MDLARWIWKQGFEGIQPETKSKCQEFFRQYAEKLRLGISRIEYYLRDKELDHQSQNELKQIEKEFKEVTELLAAFKHMIPQEPEDIEYEKWKSELIAARHVFLTIREFLGRHGERPDKINEAKQELLLAVKNMDDEKMHIAWIISKAENKLRRILERSDGPQWSKRDVKETVSWYTVDVIIDLEDFGEFEVKKNKLSALKKHIEDDLNQKLNDALGTACRRA